MMRISELRVGQQARVVAIAARDRLYRQKLVAMGVMPGTVITLLGVAPLGDPVEIEVRGTMLCLRKAEANIIQLEEV